MRIAILGFRKVIHWLVSPSDKSIVTLKEMPGCAVLHPLTLIKPMSEMEPVHQFPTGDGRTMLSRGIFHCVLPECSHNLGARDSETLLA
jgi:hypothetical protein